MKGNLEVCLFCIFQKTNTDTHTLFCVREKMDPKCIVTQGLGTPGVCFSATLRVFFCVNSEEGVVLMSLGPEGLLQ